MNAADLAGANFANATDGQASAIFADANLSGANFGELTPYPRALRDALL